MLEFGNTEVSRVIFLPQVIKSQNRLKFKASRSEIRNGVPCCATACSDGEFSRSRVAWNYVKYVKYVNNPTLKPVMARESSLLLMPTAYANSVQ